MLIYWMVIAFPAFNADPNTTKAIVTLEGIWWANQCWGEGQLKWFLDFGFELAQKICIGNGPKTKIQSCRIMEIHRVAPSLALPCTSTLIGKRKTTIMNNVSGRNLNQNNCRKSNKTIVSPQNDRGQLGFERLIEHVACDWKAIRFIASQVVDDEIGQCSSRYFGS